MILAGVALAVGVVFSKPIIRGLGVVFMECIYAPYWYIGNGGLRKGIPALVRHFTWK